jgi:hypothetical protein
MTYAKQTRKKWCSSGKVSELRQRYAQCNYPPKYGTVTRSSYLYLEQLEAEAKNRELTYETTSQTVASQTPAAARQAKHRARLSTDAREKIKRQDRQRKRRKDKIFSPPPTRFVTEISEK